MGSAKHKYDILFGGMHPRALAWVFHCISTGAQGKDRHIELFSSSIYNNDCKFDIYYLMHLGARCSSMVEHLLMV